MGLTDYSRMDKEFFESGVRAERERIIKLLEVELNRLKSFIEADPTNEFKRHRLLFAMQLISNQIALIKGENKPFITAKQAEELTNEMLEE